jgi:hypothetical protein
MWWNKKLSISTVPASLGTWPDGEPQPVRDAADRITGVRCCDVYVVVIGGCGLYDAVAVYADRGAARQEAREYNLAYGVPGDAARCARVEEIPFFPSREDLVAVL